MSTASGKRQQGRHIAIVSETFAPEINGVANTLTHLCQGLMAAGHRVQVVRPRQRDEGNQACSGSSLCQEVFTVGGIPLPGYRALQFGVSRSAPLRRLWQQSRPDTVYVATPGPLGIAAVNAARKLGITVCSGFHTNFHRYCRHYHAGFLEPALRLYSRWFHNRTDLTLAPTRQMGARLQGMGIHPVAPWSRGVDCQRFSPQRRDELLRERWGLKPQDRAVLYVGRLAPEKNLQLAVSCFERIQALHPRARFILVGEGPLRAKLEQRHPEFIFCGVQKGDALARHYASGDLFLFPSKTDTFGNVVTEAMASGLAVVAFDDAAASEHIRHQENGMMAALVDDDAFVEHALTLAQQNTLLGNIRSQARLDALDLDWTSQVEQFEQLTLNSDRRARYHAITPGITLL
ncbi:Glycosyltransferase involved in cell wall bisynthesis [Marinobacter daqiaonensis]|uniref:Glycosyltransferase involved in cell wall bisynthesis n=1 Tax=Marinobacter daqiaonensis TaxID=650891 RepID=A0A1I6J712_9GAMM|nr:glycosyltransferase family 1 protein [Marinobacter daqiaonensis]SFR74691.1 Glycosyltransferase involved in cell wall bisynthesis [Marinobacter daqiaonensis]